MSGCSRLSHLRGTQRKQALDPAAKAGTSGCSGLSGRARRELSCPSLPFPSLPFPKALSACPRGRGAHGSPSEQERGQGSQDADFLRESSPPRCEALYSDTAPSFAINFPKRTRSLGFLWGTASSNVWAEAGVGRVACCLGSARGSALPPRPCPQPRPCLAALSTFETRSWCPRGFLLDARRAPLASFLDARSPAASTQLGTPA